MRRTVTTCAVILVVLSGLAALFRVTRPGTNAPDERPAERTPPSAGEVAPAPAPPAAPEAPREGLRGRLWRRGGAPVPDLEVRLASADGTLAGVARSGEDGRFRFPAEVRETAGRGATLLVNPEPGDPWFRSFTFRPDPGAEDVDLYVPAVPRTERFDLEIRIDGAVPRAAGGEAVRVRLVDDEGAGGRWTHDPDVETLLLPGRTPGEYAVLARQGALAGFLPLRRVTPESGALVVTLVPGATILGRVVTPDGRPAADAVVRLVFDPTRHRHPTGEHVVDANRSDCLVAEEAAADEDGRFRFDGLIAAPFRLAVLHETGSLRIDVEVETSGEERELPHLRLVPARGAIEIAIPPEALARPGEGALGLLVLGYEHRERREIPLRPDQTSIAVEDLPADVYAVAVVRSTAVRGGRGQFTRFLTSVEAVEVTAGGRVVARPRPQP